MTEEQKRQYQEVRERLSKILKENFVTNDTEDLSCETEEEFINRVIDSILSDPAIRIVKAKRLREKKFKFISDGTLSEGYLELTHFDSTLI